MSSFDVNEPFSGPFPRLTPSVPTALDCEAVVLLSFGGPRRPEDVMPFLRNVTAGKGIPEERLAEVAQHYYDRGGASPINAQNEALRDALAAELARRGHSVPVYWGNRNWDPYLAEAFAAAHADGHRRLTVVPTSAYPSYSGCRQYRENIAAALATLGEAGAELDVTKLDHYWATDGFRTANRDALHAAYAELGAGDAPVHVAFVTHSIPTGMLAASGATGGEYEATHRQVARWLMSKVGRPQDTWELVYCSRSGPPHMPWAEPDINDHLRTLTERHVVVAPIGFVSDHMEVVNDLDDEAAQTAAELGLVMARAATAGTHPAFVAALADHVVTGAVRACPAACCPNLRAPQTPAACEEDQDVQAATERVAS